MTTERSRSLFECHKCRDAGEDMPRVVIDVAFGTTFGARCPVCKEELAPVHVNNAPVRMPGDLENGPHLVFACTSRDPLLSYAWHDSVTSTRSALGVARIASSELKLPGGSIQYARNRIVAGFLRRTKGTHLLFVDTDIGFRAEDVVRMMGSDRDFIAGAYPLRAIEWGRVATLPREADLMRLGGSRLVAKWTRGLGGAPVRDGDFLEADDVGAGFLLLSRAMLERMCRDADAPTYWSDEEQETQVQLFEPKVIDGHPFTEDYVFCRRWRALGGRIWVDGRARFTHWGPYPFEARAPLEQVG